MLITESLWVNRIPFLIGSSKQQTLFLFTHKVLYLEQEFVINIPLFLVPYIRNPRINWGCFILILLFGFYHEVQFRLILSIQMIYP